MEAAGLLLAGPKGEGHPMLFELDGTETEMMGMQNVGDTKEEVQHLAQDAKEESVQVIDFDKMK